MLDNIPRLLFALMTTSPDAPWCLDLYSGAGGAGMGYKLAGFNVLGVDIVNQPRYPGWFVQADALEFAREFGRYFDLIHASPPCQFASIGSKFKGTADRHENLIPATRAALLATARPYVIENVSGAAEWLRNPISLWGDLFGLRVERVRLFECVPAIEQPLLALVPPVPFAGTASHGSYSTFANGASHITVAGNNFRPEDGAIAMGINWMASRAELKEAIPPAYARYIGEQMMRVIRPDMTAAIAVRSDAAGVV